MHDVRSRRSIFGSGLVAAALFAGACSGSVSPDPGRATTQPLKPAESAPAGPPSSAGPDGSPGYNSTGDGVAALRGTMLAVGRPGEDEVRVIDAGNDEEIMAIPFGAPDRDWARIVTVGALGAATEVREIEMTSDARGEPLRLDGHWRLPTIGGDALPVGLSANGNTLVLVEDGPGQTPPGHSRFVVLNQGAALGWELTRKLDLPGSFEYDALSPTGSILYLVEHLDASNGGRYQVRSVDISSGTVDSTPISDKRFADEPMAGVPITQLRRADGLVMTLYRGPEHPFVHALNSREKWAVCIDLPADGATDAVAAKDWGLAESADGSHVFAVNATIGTVAEIDTADLNVRRSARITGATSAAEPTFVLAKFGHGGGGPVGSRAVVTPSGRTIIAGGRDGLSAIAADDLSTQWHASLDSAVRGLAVSPDGGTVYALLASGRITAVATVDGKIIATLGAEGFDRLLAVTG